MVGIRQVLPFPGICNYLLRVPAGEGQMSYEALVSASVLKWSAV